MDLTFTNYEFDFKNGKLKIKFDFKNRKLKFNEKN